MNHSKQAERFECVSASVNSAPPDCSVIASTDRFHQRPLDRSLLSCGNLASNHDRDLAASLPKRQLIGRTAKWQACQPRERRVHSVTELVAKSGVSIRIYLSDHFGTPLAVRVWCRALN